MYHCSKVGNWLEDSHTGMGRRRAVLLKEEQYFSLADDKKLNKARSRLIIDWSPLACHLFSAGERKGLLRTVLDACTHCLHLVQIPKAEQCILRLNSSAPLMLFPSIAHVLCHRRDAADLLNVPSHNSSLMFVSVCTEFAKSMPQSRPRPMHPHPHHH